MAPVIVVYASVNHFMKERVVKIVGYVSIFKGGLRHKPPGNFRFLVSLNTISRILGVVIKV
jgi:hypothetical protein